MGPSCSGSLVCGEYVLSYSREGTDYRLPGPYLHHVDISELSACAKASQRDAVNFGIECTKSLPKYEEVVVEYPSDISRLKEEVAAFGRSKYGASEEARSNADFFILSNATLVTMSTGNIHNDILRDAVLVTRNGEIEAIAGVHDFVAPYGATVLDAQGGRLSSQFQLHTSNV